MTQPKSRKASKTQVINKKVIEVGSVTKIVGDNINLKQVAEYAVQELEIRLDDALTAKRQELTAFLKEAEVHSNTDPMKKEDHKKIREIFADRIKQVCDLFKVVNYDICINEYPLNSVFLGVERNRENRGHNQYRNQRRDFDRDLDRTVRIAEYSIHLGVVETKKRHEFDDVRDDYETRREQFRMELPIKTEMIEEFQAMKDYNAKSKEIVAKYKKLVEEINTLEAQKEQLGTDSKRIHLEVMKAEIAKNTKGKALVTELNALIKGTKTAQFLVGYEAK